MAKNYNYDSVISAIDKEEALLNLSKSLNEFRLSIEPLSAQVQGTKSGEGIDKQYHDIVALTDRMYNALDLMQQVMVLMKSSAESDKKIFEDEQAAAAAAAARAASTNSGQNIDDRGYPSTTAGISTTTTTSYKPTPTYTPSRPSGGNGGYSNYF